MTYKEKKAGAVSHHDYNCFQKADSAKCWHKQVSPNYHYYFGSKGCPKNKKIPDLKVQYRWVHQLTKHLYRKKGSTAITNECKTSTAAVLHYLTIRKGHRRWNLSTVCNRRWRTPTNSRSRNANLRQRRKGTYRCRATAEVHCVSLVKSGRCSGLRWRRRGDLWRRRQSSSSSETVRGGRRPKGENEKDLGRAYL